LTLLGPTFEVLAFSSEKPLSLGGSLPLNASSVAIGAAVNVELLDTVSTPVFYDCRLDGAAILSVE
jgi:hypothetical protein